MSLAATGSHSICIEATNIVASLRLPQFNILRGQCLDIARLVNDAGAGGAGANVDADVVVLETARQSSVSVKVELATRAIAVGNASYE